MTAKKETLLEAAARRGLYYSPDEHRERGGGDDDRETEIRALAAWRAQNWPDNESYDQCLLRLLDEARAENAIKFRASDDLIGELELEIAKLRAPPSADAMEKANQLLPMGDGDGCWNFEAIRERVARAIEQAALAAREQALEEAAQAMPENYQFSSYPDLQRMAQNAVATYRGYIRALRQRKPG